jgi:Phosphotransferase enzyme family
MRASATAPGARSPLPPHEVVELARHLLAGPGGHPRLVAQEPLKTSVYRLRFDGLVAPASVVVKRLAPGRARANELVARRWLPAVGLEWACARLRGVVHELSGSAVWHIYEDVAGSGLDAGLPDPKMVGPVVELIAELHTRFAGHALLAECREHGGDLGMGFFTAQVARSMDALKAIGSLGPPLSREQAELRDCLLGRVERLDAERGERGFLVERSGGPDTLLHGDLWTTNTQVLERGEGFQARLIDWDHAGVGPVTYDLSTFLYRFAREHRPWILGRYREAVARRGWRLPDDSILNLLFETAENARYACCLAEPALAASRAERWGFEQLAEVERWFVGLEPVLAVDAGR